MKNVNELFEQLSDEQKQYNVAQAKLMGKILKELSIKYDDWSSLQKAIADSESSTSYMWNKYGDISTWFRFGALSEVEDRERYYLEQYLAEHYIIVDWDNDCLERSQGGCFVINDEGVFDTDAAKFIINSSEYGDDESLRNQLIEQHMERTGYFPTVLEEFRDDLTLVNTNGK